MTDLDTLQSIATVLRAQGRTGSGRSVERLAAELRRLRAQRDAALALCDETARNADSALDILAFVWLVRAALGVQPEGNEMQTNSPTMGGLVPPMRWCGVEHPHESHIWAQPSGMTGYCPGSTGAAAVAPDTADGRCQVLLQCHRETGHEGRCEPDGSRIGVLLARLDTAVESAENIAAEATARDADSPSAASARGQASGVRYARGIVRAMFSGETGHVGGHEAREESA